jgi:hypothetical protein
MPLQDRALVVGIDRYPAIGSLKGAEADARDFYSWVTDPAGGGVAPAMAQLVLSRAGLSQRARDAEPARHQVEQFFTGVDEAANENNEQNLGLKAGGRLWLFLSGHGFAPSLDNSGLLMANSTPTLLASFAGRLWADRLFQGGWFEEILLFQDACRSTIGVGELSPSYLKARVNPGKTRFYAFAAKDGKIALEKPDRTGNVRGVFTVTLMEGLRGGARDPVSGEITSAQLKAYLQANMKAKLSPTELDDEEISKVPDVFDPDPCVILPAPPQRTPVQRYPVRIQLGAGAVHSLIQGSNLEVVVEHDRGGTWDLDLPRGLYRLVMNGSVGEPFEVTGASRADGTHEVVNV